MPQQSKQPPASKASPPQPTEHELDRDLEDSFPASDPVASEQRVAAKSPTRKDPGILTAPTDKQKSEARRKEGETQH
ncbi:hypothetical protein [Niveispirillum sp. KHB5.9]|uniref:hypothetical protein n=1 Tax=Niveispirillum sp. KHB5.9 TaxID=3400269 RepID=UPI003A844E16